MSKKIYLLIILIFLLCPLNAYAQGPSASDIASDLIAVRALTSQQTETEYYSIDEITDTALELRNTAVLIDTGSKYGQGSIYSIDKKYIRILTAAHVLSDAKESPLVILFTGTVVYAQTEYVDADFDIGILSIRTSDIEPNTLIRLKEVNIDMEKYADFENAEEKEVFTFESKRIVNPEENQLFNLNGTGTGIADSFAYGPVLKDSILVTDFGYPMLYAKISAHSGMSGGGVFDTHGYFVGILAGGSDNNEAVAVKLTDINNALLNLEAASADELPGE